MGSDKWFYSAADSPDSTQPVEVDLNKYPVERGDIEVAKQILHVEYIVRYITCMRDAWFGNGKQECIKILHDAAVKAGNEI
jgi:hypothetical protein